MRFFKLKFRSTHIFVIPIAAVLMFTVQYYSIQYDIKKHEEKLELRLEKLGKECREGLQESCYAYTALLKKATNL